LPVQAGVIAVDGFGLGAALFALLCHWAGTASTMKAALCLAPNGWPTALNPGALAHGVTAEANYPAASGD